MDLLRALDQEPDLVLVIAAWGAAVAVGALDLWERLTRSRDHSEHEPW